MDLPYQINGQCAEEGSTMPDILRLWGKTAANDRFHPAVFHMLDVGYVATELLGDAQRRDCVARS